MKIEPATAHAHLLREKEALAVRDQDDALKVVENYRRQLESIYGYPIRVEQIKSKADFSGRVRSYWNQPTRVEAHSIELRDCFKNLKWHGCCHLHGQFRKKAKENEIGC